MAEKRKLAFYIRLSDADEEVKAGTKDESNSITGQRKLLYAYIKKTEEFAGFEVLEYFDDGYSGTMFNNRAEFQRLIQDAELGRFECIIVKDFSRFGRDYLEVGNYLEFVFPAMGMRFISVNDNYDSDRNFGVTGGMDVAYKNLIYQLSTTAADDFAFQHIHCLIFCWLYYLSFVLLYRIELFLCNKCNMMIFKNIPLIFIGSMPLFVSVQAYPVFTCHISSNIDFIL